MSKLIRGALVEYGSNFLGPIPNLVVFQFNPESLTRTVSAPRGVSSGRNQEIDQAGDPPSERISLTAHFNAADDLGENDALARLSGIGPRLSALEQMVYPSNRLGAAVRKVLDKVGDSVAAVGAPPEQPIPRDRFPRILFIWGPARVLPVKLESLTITEMLYDALLNPIQADVALSLGVIQPDAASQDEIAKGAYLYTSMVKESQAYANLLNAAKAAVDVIPF